MSLYPPTKRLIEQAITRVGKADSRDKLGLHVKDAGDLISREMRDGERRMGKAMQKCVDERKALLELLRNLNEVTRNQVERFKPESDQPN